MALSPKSPSTPATPNCNKYLPYFSDPYSKNRDGVLRTVIQPRHPNPFKAPDWTTPVYTGPVNETPTETPDFDDRASLQGNLETNPVTGVLELLKEEFPMASCVEFLLRVVPDLSSSNAVSMLLCLRKLKEKGAFKQGLRFEHILAVFMSVLAINEDFAPENYQYSRILKNKDRLEDTDFMQKCMRRRPKEGEVDCSFNEVSNLQIQLAKLIDYRLVFSLDNFNSILKEAAATGKE